MKRAIRQCFDEKDIDFGMFCDVLYKSVSILINLPIRWINQWNLT